MTNHEVLVEKTPVQLTAADNSWLARFGVDTSALDYDGLNSLIERGSLNLTTTRDEQIRNETEQARKEFLEFLGINPSSKSIVGIFPRLPLNDRLISSVRNLEDHDLDGPAIFRKYPSIIKVGYKKIGAAKERISLLGFNSKKAIEQYPPSVNVPDSRVISMIGFLDSRGIKGKKALTRDFSIVGLSEEKIDNTIEFFNSRGIDGIKAFNTDPQLIFLSHDKLDKKLEFLESLGVESLKAVKSSASILTRSPEKILEVFNFLQSQGIDAAKVLTSSPRCAGSKISTLQSTIDAINSTGVDAAKMINKQPNTLARNENTLISRIDNTLDHGISVEAIEKAPSMTGLTEKLLAKRVRLVQRLTKTLKWEGDAIDLIETIPSILSYKSRKLLALARIACDRVTVADRNLKAKSLRSVLITPLEKYMLALADGRLQAERISVIGLRKMAEKQNYDQETRRETALNLAQSGKLGEIGVSYIKYREAA